MSCSYNVLSLVMSPNRACAFLVFLVDCYFSLNRCDREVNQDLRRGDDAARAFKEFFETAGRNFDKMAVQREC